MAMLRIGGQDFPLVMTVGVLDDLAQAGYPIQDVPKFFSPTENPLEEAINNGIKLLHDLMAAGQEAAAIREGLEPMEIPEQGTLRRLLTPGQVWGLCDAAILASLSRTVEAAPGKNPSAVTKSP